MIVDKLTLQTEFANFIQNQTGLIVKPVFVSISHEKLYNFYFDLLLTKEQTVLFKNRFGHSFYEQAAFRHFLCEYTNKNDYFVFYKDDLIYINEFTKEPIYDY